MKQTYEVRILNQKFHLKTEGDEMHVKQVSDFVNKVFHEIVTKNPSIPTQNVAILGALNIAEEMFSKQDQHRKKIADWKARLEASVKKNK